MTRPTAHLNTTKTPSKLDTARSLQVEARVTAVCDALIAAEGDLNALDSKVRARAGAGRSASVLQNLIGVYRDLTYSK